MDMKKNQKGKISDIILKVIIIAVVILLAVTLIKTFWGWVHKDGNDTTKESVSVSELDKLINRNLDVKYPETATAVADLYCSITQQLHRNYKEDELKEEQVTKLCGQLRALMDDELLEHNDYKEHLEKLNKEISQYRKDKMFISRYTVQESKDVKEYKEDDGRDYTKIQIVYSVKKGSGWLKQNEELILRKDEDGRWKILGNQLSESTEEDDEE